MWLTQTYPSVGKKNLDKEEARKDIGAFSSLEGEPGDRILEHLCASFSAFDTKRTKEPFEAGFDEGVRAVLIYIAAMRSDYGKIKLKIEEN